MAQAPAKKVTTVEELSRIYFRFINVSDDKQLTGILSKLLGTLLMIYLEQEGNVNGRNTHLEDIMSHLISRVTNSKGAVKPPIAQILNIVNSPTFTESENRLAKTRILTHVFAFLQIYSMMEAVQEEDKQVYMICLESLKSETLPMHFKCRLFILFLHRVQLGYFGKSVEHAQSKRQLAEELNVIFAADFSLKKAFVHFSLLLVIGMFPNWQNNLRVLFEQAMANYRNPSSRLPMAQFLLSFEQTVFSIITNGEVFTESKEYLPVLLIAAADASTATGSSIAIPMLKTIVLDTEDLDLSTLIYQMIFGNFSMFFAEESPDYITHTPLKVQEHLMSFLMKFPAAVIQKPFNLRLVDHCLHNTARYPAMQAFGLRFIRAMIYSAEQMNEETQWHLKNTLERVRTDSNGIFTTQSVATSYLLLAELAAKSYHLVFGGTIDLATDVFRMLQRCVEDCLIESRPVRMDDVALTYMEAVNKFRDCFELHLKDESNRRQLVSFVENFLASEGTSSNSEIVYIIFLYLARLGGDNLTAAILLNSIILKTHEDIKIKKEAQTQLDRFSKAEDSAVQGLLMPFLRSLSPYFNNHLITTMDADRPDQLAGALVPVMDVTSAMEINGDFIEKVEQMSHFAHNFFKREMSKVQRSDSKPLLEQLLITNLHESFSRVKSDFTKIFKLMEQYLQEEDEAPVLSTIPAARCVSRLSHGANCVNLEQKILGLRLLFAILEKQASAEERRDCLSALYHAKLITDNAPDKELPKGQEQRLSLLFRDTLQIAFSSDEVARGKSMERFMAYAAISVQEKLSPNQMELQKMVANSLALLARAQPVKQILAAAQGMQVDEGVPDGSEGQLGIDQVVEKLREAVCNRSVDVAYKSHVLGNLALLCKGDADLARKLSQALMDSLKDYDQVDFQHVLGKALCEMWLQASLMTHNCDQLIEAVSNSEGIELNIKRNYVTYLHHVLIEQGETNEEVKSKLLPLQQIFLKFLFDRRSSMQDLASKSLSTIYNLGDEETRTKLVDALSSTFTGKTEARDGGTVAQEFEEMKGQELPAEFQDNTSSEQRKKMKTYKDLVSVANQLGSQQLIYSFLEIHRSVTQLQDVQNAAKGLSNIIMLDKKLKSDLLKLAPSILLLTYDQNKEVSHTMRELWTVLIDIDKESQVVHERWNEIYAEAFKCIQSTDNARNKLRAVRALTDLMGNRSWAEISSHFRVIFLTSLASLESEKRAEKAACYQLAKVLKQIALKLGNVYTNGDEVELRQVLSTVIPMVIDDCLKSGIEPVRWFGLDLLSDIVMTARSQNVAEKLKIKSKHERQLMFNYNSAQKIKQILNFYMERIVVEIIGNTSMLSKAVQQINSLESLAMELGYLKPNQTGNAGAAKRYGISERDIFDMRNKMTKDSTQGEILAICREMMTTDTFDKILPQILQFCLSGHDITTKQIAVTFINDIVLEGRLELISPKNSRLIARKLIDVYSQSTVQAGLGMKQGMQALYASCLGQQIKILREFPNTVKQLLDNLADLDQALEVIKVINLNEIIKGLPESMLEDEEGDSIVKRFVPTMFVNRYKTSEDARIKQLSKRNWEQLVGNIPSLAKTNCAAILTQVAEMFDSTQYDDRVASAQALQELCTLVTEGQLEDPSFDKAIDAIMALISGKYFNGKEKVVECLAFLVSEDYLASEARKIAFLQVAISQAQKAAGNYNDYKNVLIQAMRTVCLKIGLGRVPAEIIQEIFDFLIVQITQSLDQVVEQEGSGMLAEQQGVFFDLNEKREDDKATLRTVQVAYSVMPRLLATNPNPEATLSMAQILVDASADKFVRTNWLVRQAILVCFKGLLELKKKDKLDKISLVFGADLVCKAAEYGEKYDQNLVYLSGICLLVAEQVSSLTDPTFALSAEQKTVLGESAHKLIAILQDKGTEVLIQNVDLIKRYIGKIQQDANSAAAASDVEMSQH